MALLQIPSLWQYHTTKLRYNGKVHEAIITHQTGQSIPKVINQTPSQSSQRGFIGGAPAEDKVLLCSFCTILEFISCELVYHG